VTTRLADLVRTSAAVASTSSRTAKVAALAELLRRLGPQEVRTAVGFLTGRPRQGRIGIGYATVYGVDAKPSGQPSLSIDDVDRAIEDVRATTGPGSGAARKAVLAALIERATHEEADFIRRLFTGELRQGALEGLMAEAVSTAAGIAPAAVRRAVMLEGDLGRVAETALRDPTSLDGVGFELFRPVKPMLASTATDVEQAMASFELASVEWKLDGIRVQVHRRGDEVRLYTRSLHEIDLPGVIDAVRTLDVTEAVFDGEAIGFGEGDRPEAFQDTMKRIGGESGMSVFLFDCLYIDGEHLVDATLRERLERLEAAAGALRIPGAITTDAAQAQRLLDDALAAGHEGVVVKDAASTYTAGRRGKAWRKVKPVRTLDLVVLAAEWGHGRRRGWLSNLHLGARDPSGGFVMVGKTFKGLTDELLEWQTAALTEREVRREGITVFVRPELVVEIGLDGVQVSPRYPGGVALRFARVKRYRPDKTPDEADTIGTVRGMLQR
jgi:DNA ligase-1